MSLVVDMLLKFLQAKGRLLDHVQLATLRKMRGTYTKNYELLPSGSQGGSGVCQREVSSEADFMPCSI